MNRITTATMAVVLAVGAVVAINTGRDADASVSWEPPKWEQERWGNGLMTRIPHRAVTSMRLARAEAVSLTVKAIGRSGSPVVGETEATVIELSTADQYQIWLVDGVGSVEVPPGRYAISAVLREPGATTLAYLPAVHVTSARQTTLDARSGRRVSVSLDQRHAQQLGASVYLVQPTEVGGLQSFPVVVQDLAREPVYVTPTAAINGLDLHVHTTWATDASVFNLLSTSHSGIPARPSYSVRTRELARVQTRYAAAGSTEDGLLSSFPLTPGDLIGVTINYSTLVPIELPSTRVEYHTPGPMWVSSLLHGGPDFTDKDTLLGQDQYDRPGAYTRGWNTAPTGPGLPSSGPSPVGGRWGEGGLSMTVPLYSDAEPGHLAAGPYAGVTGSTELYRDGQLLASSMDPGAIRDGVSISSGTYHLTVAANRNVSWAAYGTEQKIDWTLVPTLDGESDQPIPLLAVRYRAPLDLLGRAKSGRPCELVLWVETGAADQVPVSESLTLRVSYDDGAHWSPVRIRISPGSIRATLNPPRNATFVSLAAGVRDRAGNSVDQTIIRAFGLT